MSHHLLPVKHFHLIFTVPHELKDLVFYNKKRLYGLLFEVANETVQSILGGKIGMVSTLHSWGSNLAYHPHLHVIVAAGSYKNGGWRPSYPTNPRCFCKARELREKFKELFLIKLLSVIELENLYWGKAQIDAPEIFPKIRQLYHKIQRKKWVVRIENPVLGVGQIIEYLARYVRRVAITNSRIVEVTTDRVVISYKQYALQKKGKAAPVGKRKFEGAKFIQQFSQHFMPRGFHKVRYYGFYSFGAKALKGTIEEQLTGQRSKAYEKPSTKAIVKKLLGVDMEVCRHCGLYESFVTELLLKDSSQCYKLTQPYGMQSIRAGPRAIQHNKGLLF